MRDCVSIGALAFQLYSNGTYNQVKAFSHTTRASTLKTDVWSILCHKR